jgi:hydroxyacylglutathione hydrolase
LKLSLQRLEVGPWPMNCYLLRCPATGTVAIVDPGDDAPAILEAVGSAPVACILLTHGHPDHVGALDLVRQATGVPAGIHPADAEAWGSEADFPLLDGMEIEVGSCRLTVLHLPGHTPGSVAFRLDGQALVGDAIFPGGPGHTQAPEDLARSVTSLGLTVFAWPDPTELWPGHGPHTTVGAERGAFERFLATDHPPDLCGDVTW